MAERCMSSILRLNASRSPNLYKTVQIVMSLHHGLTDLRDNILTCYITMLYFPWFQATYQASLRFCQRANLTIKIVQIVLCCAQSP